MTIYRLDKELWFPPPHEYEEHGVIAIGGDLSPARLLKAYSHGIFPWYSEDEPITWWCPPQRMVLRPQEVHVSKSSRNLLNRKAFEIRADTDFAATIEGCQKAPRPGQKGTWLNDELKASMQKLHKMGYAHSIEAWQNGRLVGGLYGLGLGKIFFGDSMFSLVSNASKVAFIHLCHQLTKLGFTQIDCQVHNEHLARLGAYEIPRQEFMQELALNRLQSGLHHHWTSYFEAR